MLVMKFGGTSVGSAENIRRVVEIVGSKAEQRPIVVVSAISRTTDMLIQAANNAAKGDVSVDAIRARHHGIIDGLGIPGTVIEEDLHELRHVLQGVSFVRKVLPELYARVVSFGERMSSKIVAAYARSTGINAASYDAYGLGLITDSNFEEAFVLPESYGRIASHLSSLPQNEIPIITGFIAKDADGSITTLGRGGSDYTASIFGIAANASEVQIWTDVSGVMTADPRVVPEAHSIMEVSFNEAAELAYFGAKVLHPKTIYPAVQKNIPVKVLNTFKPDDAGTTITNNVKNHDVLTAIAHKGNVTLINVTSPRMLFAYGFMEELFDVFARHKIAVDNISTSEVSVSVTVDRKYNVSRLVDELSKMAKVDVSENRASISVVGHGVKHTPGIAGTIFSTLGDASINTEMISMGASEINISFVVENSQVEKAVRLLHQKFFETAKSGAAGAEHASAAINAQGV